MLEYQEKMVSSELSKTTGEIKFHKVLITQKEENQTRLVEKHSRVTHDNWALEDKVKEMEDALKALEKDK